MAHWIAPRQAPLCRRRPSAQSSSTSEACCASIPPKTASPASPICSDISTPDLLRLFWAHRIDYDAGLVDSRAYWTQIANAAGRPVDDALLATLIEYEIELWNNYDRRILGWAAHLRSSGIRTAILSNLPRVLGEALRATPGFLDPFDHVTFSYELKIVKPRGGAFTTTPSAASRVPPSEALFLDDKPENVEGARAVGIASRGVFHLGNISRGDRRALQPADADNRRRSFRVIMKPASGLPDTLGSLRSHQEIWRRRVSRTDRKGRASRKSDLQAGTPRAVCSQASSATRTRWCRRW